MTVSLSVSTVYETGVMGPDGVVLPADYTGGVVASLNGVDYSVASVIPYLSIEDNIIIIEQDTTPDVMDESEVMYYDLTGQPTAAQEIPSNDTAEYRIVQQNDLNGVQAADGTMTVDYQYRYIKEGVEGSTWYVCQNSERKYGLVDITTGEEILPCMYDQVGFVLGDGQSNVNNFEMGVCYVILDGREYLVNADNEVVAEVTGYGLSEATNGLYFSQTYYAYVDNEGKLVLPGYLDTRELDDPYSSYTLYQKDGAVYQISANYLINAEDISTYGQSTAVYMPDFTLALTTIDTSAAAQFYLQGDSFDATGIVVLHSMVCTGAPVDVAAEVSYAIGEEPLAVGDALDTQGVCTVRVLYEDVEIGTFEVEVLDSAVDYILPGDYYIVSGDFYVSEYIYRESSYYYVLGTADDCSVFTVTWQGGDDYTIQAKDSGNYIGNSFMGQLEGVTSSQPVWTLTKSGSSYTMTTANWPDMVVTPNWDEGVGAWIYLQSAEDATAANTQLQFVPVA